MFIDGLESSKAAKSRLTTEQPDILKWIATAKLELHILAMFVVSDWLL